MLSPLCWATPASTAGLSAPPSSPESRTSSSALPVARRTSRTSSSVSPCGRGCSASWPTSPWPSCGASSGPASPSCANSSGASRRPSTTPGAGRTAADGHRRLRGPAVPRHRDLHQRRARHPGHLARGQAPQPDALELMAERPFTGSPAGLLLILAGIWLGAQTLLGGLVDRILGSSTSSGSSSSDGSSSSTNSSTPGVGATVSSTLAGVSSTGAATGTGQPPAGLTTAPFHNQGGS